MNGHLDLIADSSGKTIAHYSVEQVVLLGVYPQLFLKAIHVGTGREHISVLAVASSVDKEALFVIVGLGRVTTAVNDVLAQYTALILWSVSMNAQASSRTANTCMSSRTWDSRWSWSDHCYPEVRSAREMYKLEWHGS